MPAIDPRIRALTDQFVADLNEVIHEAALEAVRETARFLVPAPYLERRTAILDPAVDPTELQ